MKASSEASQAVPAGAALDTYADNCSRLMDRASETPSGRRYALRNLLWSESSVRRLRACGRCRRKDVSDVAIRVSGDTLGLAGLQHCGMVWICPVCSGKVWAERCLEIGLAAAGHVQAGGRVAMATFTTRHRFGDGLAGLVGHLRGGWEGAFRGRAGMELKAELDLDGYIRVLEINTGSNGWHPHFHVALFLPSGMSQERVEQLLEPAFSNWCQGVKRVGGRVPERQAQDVRVFGPQDSDELAKYLAKQFLKGSAAVTAAARGGTAGPPQAVAVPPTAVGMALGREMTQAARKNARKVLGTRPHWSLLDDIRDNGDADALLMWHELERATHKVRGITWSQGLRQRYALGEERSEQEIVDDDLAGRNVCFLTEDGYRTLLGRVYAVPEMATVWKAGRWPALREWLQCNGIEHITLGDNHG